MNKIYEWMIESKQTSCVLKADGFMDLNVEIIEEDLVSFCHYGEQNGDLMRDPEMIFQIIEEQKFNQRTVKFEAQRRFIPKYYRNDYAGFEQSVLDCPNRRLDYQLPRVWNANIKHQGFIQNLAGKKVA